LSVEDIDVVASFLDVGHGDAVVIRFREGHELRTIVVDGGGPEHSDVLLSYLLDNTVARIDLLVASHIDRNHVAGMIPVVESERLTIQNFWGPACESARPSVQGLRTSDERTYQRLYSRITQRVRAEHILCPTRGMPLPTLFRDCALTVLNPIRQNVLTPPADDAPAKKPADIAIEQNELSLVLHIECHGLSLLLTSDLGGHSFAGMVADAGIREFLSVDIMKVAHYGRAGSAGGALTQALRDRCAAVLSAAPNDDRGVSPETLSVLQEVRAELFCTAHTPGNAFCHNPHCRAANGGQNIVFFYRRGAPSFTPSADACVLS